jgi:hypothetical protein
MSKEAILATKQTLLVIVGLATLIGVSVFASRHPDFLFYVLMPVASVAILVLVWLFFYSMAKIK